MAKKSAGIHFLIAVLLLVVIMGGLSMAEHDYGEALYKSLLFFEAQRSGYLPSNQRVQWRGNSGLSDGKINGVDLVGGYYDAGDNVKFGLPMAFTVTMMSWSIIQYGNQMSAMGELHHAMDAVKWGTDYLIKAHPQPDVLYGEVGDGNTDHDCWQRPEDMTTSRQAYKIDPSHAGSDLAGETAAAMAAASIVFNSYNASYASLLLEHAEQLFEFADKHRGKYDNSITVVQKYYRSFSGYEDELLWAAAWLYEATNKEYYLNYVGYNGDAFGGTGWAVTQFGWDVKYAGVQTLVAKWLMAGKGGRQIPVFQEYQKKAELFMCSCLGKGTNNVLKTPGGLIFKQRWNNMQYVTSASFLTTVYSDYLTSAGKSLNCAQGVVSPTKLISFAKSQVDYILGDNPRATSYMVGYGKNYPQQVHHRASSIVSYKADPSFVSCRGGYASWFSRKASDPNVLTGAIVGGPDAYDNFADQRDNYEQTEPATYNTAPLLGVLARLHGGHSGRNQLLHTELPALKPHVNALNPEAKPVINPAPASSGIKSPISITQKMTTSWTYNGRTYYRYSATITNKSSSNNINYLKLFISKLYGPLWGLTKLAGNDDDKHEAYYSFPTWINSLGAGKSIEFVYIHSASLAEISISSYMLV